MEKYKLWWIETRFIQNPSKEKINEIMSNYNKDGIKTKNIENAIDNSWTQFELSLLFDAQNQLDAKRKAIALYKGTAGDFIVYNLRTGSTFTNYEAEAVLDNE